jgi:acyl dehydratase
MTAAEPPSAPSGIEVGQEIEPYVVKLTLQRLVLEAGANRDFAPIHFDADAARDSGAAGPYANTTFIETLFEAALRTWAGLAARIRMIEFSMKSFNVTGDEIAAHGRVTAFTGDIAELDLWIEGPRGTTVVGRATVAFSPPS